MMRPTHRRLAAITALTIVANPLAMSRPAAAQEGYASPPAAASDVSAAAPPSAQQFGFGANFKYVSVPSWFLDLFTKQNTPLSSVGFALEGVRRKDDLDIVVSAGYQDMSAGDGNWLGKGKSAAVDTDLVQFRSLSIIHFGVTFIWNTWLNDYLGVRYGTGLGLGIVRGKILRTSAAGCTEANAGDETMCKPIVCQGTSCTESELLAIEGGRDNGPSDPRRFKEDDVPGAIPVLHLLVGLAFRIPEAPGLEFRFDGGFHDAFYLSLGGGYVF